MTDLEITRLCADAMGLRGHQVRDGQEMWSLEGWERNKDAIIPHHGEWKIWNPLHNDAQAMALVKEFRLLIGNRDRGGVYEFTVSGDGERWWKDEVLNRAICECVAKMCEERTPKANVTESA